jgi:hypothetical protein
MFLMSVAKDGYVLAEADKAKPILGVKTSHGEGERFELGSSWGVFPSFAGWRI